MTPIEPLFYWQFGHPWVAGAAILGAVLVALAVVLYRWDVLIEGAVGLGILGAILVLFCGPTAIIATIPFDSDYRQVYEATGQIVSVENSITSGDGEFAQRPVVILEGVDEPLLVEDPRVLSMVGETATIRCSLEWVPQGRDRYNCWIAGDEDE